jgi:tRNA pseudouridine38-40 synthase
MRIALGLEYDGSRFYGWQKQREAPGIQAAVEQAIGRIVDHPVNIVVAGRTDRGVHAVGQVVHFDTHVTRPLHAYLLGSNNYLSPEVSVQWVQPVSDDFHARFSAVARRYRYIILNHRARPALFYDKVTWYHRPLDEKRMQEAAHYLIGEHDFSSFRAADCQAKSPIRTVHFCNITRQGDYVMMDVKANAFLHHMVRNIAGVLMAVGEGKASPEWCEAVLREKQRAQAGITAPSAGLYFMQAYYPDHFGLPVGENRLITPL